MFQAYLIFSFLQPLYQLQLQETMIFFPLRLVFRNLDLGISYAVCYYCVIASWQSQWIQLENICVCINLQTHSYISLYHPSVQLSIIHLIYLFLKNQEITLIALIAVQHYKVVLASFCFFVTSFSNSEKSSSHYLLTIPYLLKISICIKHFRIANPYPCDKIVTILQYRCTILFVFIQRLFSKFTKKMQVTLLQFVFFRLPHTSSLIFIIYSVFQCVTYYYRFKSKNPYYLTPIPLFFPPLPTHQQQVANLFHFQFLFPLFPLHKGVGKFLFLLSSLVRFEGQHTINILCLLSFSLNIIFQE